MIIFAYSFRRCDDRSDEIFSQGYIPDIHHIKPATSSLILKLVNPDSKTIRQYTSANKLYSLTSDVIINPENPVNPDSKTMRQHPSTNKLYFLTSEIIINQKNQKNHKNPGSDYYCRKM